MSRVRLVVVAVGVLMAMTPVTAVADDPYAVSATVKRTVMLGSKVLIKGTVSPKATGATVKLQSRTRKSAPWVTVKTTSVTDTGSFSARHLPDKAGKRWYRVVKPADRRHGSGVSAVLPVIVYRWHYLADFAHVDDHGTRQGVTRSINGTSYKETLVNEGQYNAFVEYNLSRKCRSLKATYGITDDSTTGSVGDIEVLADGNSLLHQQFALGEQLATTLDVRGVLRVRFDLYDIPDDKQSYAAVGAPRVLCAF